MPAAFPHFSSLRRSQHNYVRAMPALKFQQNLRQNRLYRTLARPGDGAQNPLAAMMLVRRGLHIFCETVFCNAM